MCRLQRYDHRLGVTPGVLVRVGELQDSKWRMNLLDFGLVFVPFPRRLTLPFIVQGGSPFQGN
jgi:hypothetical protein